LKVGSCQTVQSSLAPLPWGAQVAGSTVALPDGSSPGDVLFSGDGSRLLGVRVNTSLIDSFAVQPDGRLAAAPGSPFAAQGAGPFGSEFRPTDSAQLFVSNAHNGGTNLGTVSAFAVGADGTLTSIGSSPYPDFQNAPCWVEISHDGAYLFAVNTGSTTISGYRISADGSLTNVSTTGFRSGTGIRPFDARLDPTGADLYVVDAALNAVSAFAVSGGALNEISGSAFSLPVGATPFGLVAI